MRLINSLQMYSQSSIQIKTLKLQLPIKIQRWVRQREFHPILHPFSLFYFFLSILELTLIHSLSLSILLKSDPLAHRGEILYSDDEGDLSDDSTKQNQQPQQISKRKLKKLQRLTVSELKQMVSKPELVEYSDVNSNDPKLLIGLKSLRNSIPIPPHWSLKRDYLQNKRGIEKAEYRLPSE